MLMQIRVPDPCRVVSPLSGKLVATLKAEPKENG